MCARLSLVEQNVLYIILGYRYTRMCILELEVVHLASKEHVIILLLNV